MTNYGFRMLPLCHSERLLFVIPNAVRNLVRKRKEILRFALNDKRPNAEEHPPSPPFKGGKSAAKGDVIPFKGGNAELTADCCKSPERAR